MLEKIEILKQNVDTVVNNLKNNTYKDEPPAKLIAVTKTETTDTIKMLLDLGITDIAENRLPVIQQKVSEIENIKEKCKIHFIGRLQSNKINGIIKSTDFLHSLDRISIAKEIQKKSEILMRTIPCFLQVNIANESQKAGVSPLEVISFLKEINSFSNLKIIGLMAMMPFISDEKVLTHYFQKMRILFENVRDEAITNINMEELSMGMSNDYILAAKQGATMVRVGSALFTNL